MISTAGLLSAVVYLVIVGLIFWCIFWFISFVGVPEPFNKVIKVVVALVALILAVNFLLAIAGTPLFR